MDRGIGIFGLRRPWGCLALCIVLSFGPGRHGLSAAGPKAEERRPPNIVVILADDFGYGSLGCYGAEGLRTPNLDRLAHEGRKFRCAYTPGSVCSPTRYGLMTGRYYWRTSIKDGEVLPVTAPLHIETDRLTLASLCRGRGYRTAAFGKWHLGLGDAAKTDWNRPLKPGPLEIGFNHFFGLAANPWNGPHSFIKDYEITGRIPGQPVILQAGGRQNNTTSGIIKPWEENQIMQTLTERTVAWLEENGEGPFFLYFAPNAVHRPVAPNPHFQGSRYGVYGDFIHELDWSVGRLLDTLDRLKRADDTLVIFTSDNGGVVNPNVEEVAAAMRAGLAINGPLRGGKHDIWEGGFRVPLLVRWPGRVPAGTTSDQVIGLVDMLATLAGFLDVPLPAGQAEDSFDARAALFETEPSRPVRDHIILQDAHATYAIRMGNWKLVERVGAPPVEPRNRNAAQKLARAKKEAPRHDELFDLASDPSESNDVHAEHPDIVAKLRRALAEARDRGHTRPGGTP
ncbi:MAG: arylsulfatase [Isosphaeraceae bacterium]|nr:arylsulfatase [Isosphaeraceae bacterium]